MTLIYDITMLGTNLGSKASHILLEVSTIIDFIYDVAKTPLLWPLAIALPFEGTNAKAIPKEEFLIERCFVVYQLTLLTQRRVSHRTSASAG